MAPGDTSVESGPSRRGDDFLVQTCATEWRQRSVINSSEADCGAILCLVMHARASSGSVHGHPSLIRRTQVEGARYPIDEGIPAVVGADPGGAFIITNPDISRCRTSRSAVIRLIAWAASCTRLRPSTYRANAKASAISSGVAGRSGVSAMSGS